MSDVIEGAIAAHGGRERWSSVDRLTVRFSLTGGLYAIKGHPDGFVDATMVVDAQQPRTIITPFPAHGGTAAFMASSVTLRDVDGAVLSEVVDPRASFAGHTLHSPWNEAQLVYFSSYALWNYLTTPFLFDHPGFAFKDLPELRENGEHLRPVAITFPDDVPTHCKTQTFYFNADGMLRRIDYVTDVAGGVASHYCFDPVRFGGILFPTLRRVVPRTADGPAINGPTAVLLQITDVLVEAGP